MYTAKTLSRLLFTEEKSSFARVLATLLALARVSGTKLGPIDAMVNILESLNQFLFPFALDLTSYR